MAVDSNDYTTLTSAADSAGVAVSTLRYWIETGRLMATSSERGRLVRLSDVQELVAQERDGAGQSNGGDQDSGAHSIAAGDADGGDMRGAEATTLVVARSGTVQSVRRRRSAGAGNVAAFMAKVDELYREQIAAKDGEIAAKNELIGELRLRAERAENQAAQLEQKLAGGQAEEAAAMAESASAPRDLGLFARLKAWYLGRPL